jgi:hypothetical protein
MRKYTRTEDIPQWMRDMAARYWHKKVTIQFAEVPARCRHGLAIPNRRTIKLWCPAEQCPTSVRLLLHELGHIAVPHKSPFYGSRHGQSYHGVAFCRKVAVWYAEEGVYDDAAGLSFDRSARDGYKCVRDFLRTYRDEYMKGDRYAAVA